MASEEKVSQYAREAGYEPLEDRCIIVKPAPGDLSEKIVAFSSPSWSVSCACSRCANMSSSSCLLTVCGPI